MKVKQFAGKYYIHYLINWLVKLYDVDNFLILFYAMCYEKLSCFIKEFCKQPCWIKFNLIAYSFC